MIYKIEDKEKQTLLEKLMREHGIEFVASEYNYQQVLRSELEFLIEESKQEDRTPEEFSILANIENNMDDIIEELWESDDSLFAAISDITSEFVDNALCEAGQGLSLELRDLITNSNIEL